jgi:hypothetical protein
LDRASILTSYPVSRNTRSTPANAGRTACSPGYREYAGAAVDVVACIQLLYAAGLSSAKAEVMAAACWDGANPSAAVSRV